MRRTLIVQLIILLSLTTTSLARERQPSPLPVEARATTAGPQASGSPIEFTPLASYDFEDGAGQGWTARDLTLQPGTFFHVDDFADLTEFTPLSGTKSLWCGTRATGEFCHFVDAGYGNAWRQHFESTNITGSGPMTLQFDIRYDTEAGYDFFYVDTWSGSEWTEVAAYDGANTTTLTFPNVFSSSGRVRFRFESDRAYSDEDGRFPTRGAVVVDNIVVSDSTGVVYSQDFESEAFGSLATNDGVWQATTPPEFGKFTKLYLGATVFQQAAAANTTNVWGFTDGSPDDYTCGGFPGVPVVPFSTGPDKNNALANAIESPAIAIPPGPLSTLRLSFDVYADLPLDNLVAYRPAVQFEVDGCWQAWEPVGAYYYSPSLEWFRQAFEFSVPTGATAARVALRVLDVCWAFCGQLGSGACHSNGPLFDNVAVALVSGPSLIVTNTNDAGLGSLRDAIEQANTAPGLDVITFDLPGTGPFIIMPDSMLPEITDTLTIDGYSQPGASPNSNGQDQGSNAAILIQLDGSNASGDGLRLGAIGCTVRGLSITNFYEFMQVHAAIAVTGNSCRVEGCFLGTGPAGTQDDENYYGIWVDGEAVTIGGSTTDCRNVISGNVYQIKLESGARDAHVFNNLIGTNAAGTASITGGTGVWIWEVPNAVIGGIGLGNVISGGVLGPGVSVRTTAAVQPSDQVTISSNKIGTDVSGEHPVPNGLGIGVSFQGDHTVGIYDNVIAYNNFTFLNGNYGVSANNVTAGTWLDLRGNRIFDNEGLDVWMAPEQLPAPVIQSITVDAFQNASITVFVSGGPPSTNLALDIYSSFDCDEDGVSGQGQFLEDQQIFPLDGSGSGTYQFALGNVVAPMISVKTWSLGPAPGTSHFSDCASYDNTPAGVDVSVDLVDQNDEQKSSVVFDNVTNDGFTSVTSSESSPAGAPVGFLVQGQYCDIVTTSSYSDSIAVYVEYDPATLPGPESDTKLLHYDDSLVPPAWVDVTTFVDEIANRVCGRVASLSPFVVIYPVTSTGVRDEPPALAALTLGQNYPNPFNPTTTIGYDVPANSGHVELVIFDVYGRRVRTLVARTHQAGAHTVTWDGKNGRGDRVTSGVYFYRLSAGNVRMTRKLLILK